MRFDFSSFKVKSKYSVFLFIFLYNKTPGYLKHHNNFKYSNINLHPLSNFEDNLP